MQRVVSSWVAFSASFADAVSQQKSMSDVELSELTQKMLADTGPR
jgi:uncharacterized protein YbaA (DUF1428 family)